MRIGIGDVGEAEVPVAFGVGAVANGGHLAALEADDWDGAPAVAAVVVAADINLRTGCSLSPGGMHPSECPVEIRAFT